MNGCVVCARVRVRLSGTPIAHHSARLSARPPEVFCVLACLCVCTRKKTHAVMYICKLLIVVFVFARVGIQGHSGVAEERWQVVKWKEKKERIFLLLWPAFFDTFFCYFVLLLTFFCLKYYFPSHDFRQSKLLLLN